MKLADYLTDRAIKRTDFAALIDVSQSYVTQLCQGHIWPGRDIINRIAVATDGAVTANDFMMPPLSPERAEQAREATP